MLPIHACFAIHAVYCSSMLFSVVMVWISMFLFFQLLQQEKFAPLDKVRALFNGYVIVVGVNPQFLLEVSVCGCVIIKFAQLSVLRGFQG